MTLRTGKGGRYRYYTCSIKARQGETGCKGRSIPMEKLDSLVAKHLADRLLQPERLEELLASILDRLQERTERRREHIAELNKRAAETDLRLKRLYGRDRGRRRRSRRPGAEGARRKPQDDPRPGASRRCACRRDAGDVKPTIHLAADGPEVRQDGTRADQDRRRRLPPRPSPRARPARRGGRSRGPHHRLKDQSASDTGHRSRRKAGYARRSQFCSEMAEGMSACILSIAVRALSETP
ncbi:zinc ribbon domain-containing protein [Acidiphilium sp. AL]|nr:zinc ribbon domain-containing protein [Acidiphilium sp. AL]